MLCKLCLQKRPIKRSHIIPEFFYAPIYESLHQLQKITIVQQQKSYLQVMQKGLRDRLLCDECETRFNRYETYASQLLVHDKRIETRIAGGVLHVRPIDYDLFKLFQLSILWRASVSCHDFFSEVDLGLMKSEQLRRLLYEENPGKPEDFGCMVFFTVEEGKLTEDVIMQPDRIRLGHGIAYRFLFGGAIWIFLASKVPSPFKYLHLFLHPNQPWQVPLLRAKNVDLFQGLGKAIRSSGALRFSTRTREK